MSIFHDYPESEVSVNLTARDQRQIEGVFMGLAAKPLPRTGILAPDAPVGYIAVKLVDDTWGLARFNPNNGHIQAYAPYGRVETFTTRLRARSEALRLSLATVESQEKKEEGAFWVELSQIFNRNIPALQVYLCRSSTLPLRELLFRLNLAAGDLPNLTAEYAERGPMQAELYQRLQSLYLSQP